MNILPAFMRRTKPQASGAMPSPYLPLSWGNNAPMFGESVDENTAMAVASCFRCVTLISGLIGALDLGIYTDDPRLGRVPVVNRITPLLTLRPYPSRQMTSYVWKEIIAANILLHGNHYSVIRRDNAARVVALEYAPPWIVTVMRDNDTQRNVYKVQWPQRDAELVDQDSMIHVPGPGWDGYTGLSRIRQNARNTLAMARSIEEVAGRAHDNAMTPRLIVKPAPGMTADAIKRMRAFIDKRHAGKHNTGVTLYVDPGTEIEALDINVVDLALIQHMAANSTQICMFFGVPPVLLGLEQTTSWGSGIEQILLGFLRFSLNPDLERIEAEFTSKLCGPGQYCLFDRDQLLAMDAQTQASVASTEISCGLSTINESRARKHRCAVEGGDTVLINSANVPLSRALEPTQPVAPPPAQLTNGIIHQ